MTIFLATSTHIIMQFYDFATSLSFFDFFLHFFAKKFAKHNLFIVSLHCDSEVHRGPRKF